MTFRGHIKDGHIVLDDPVVLPEGAAVTVDVTTDPPVPLSERLKHVIGKVTNLPPDASTQKRHYLYGHPIS